MFSCSLVGIWGFLRKTEAVGTDVGIPISDAVVDLKHEGANTSHPYGMQIIWDIDVNELKLL